MKGRTHLAFTKMFFPEFDDRMVDKVNESMDQPSEFDMIMSNMMGNGLGLPGMWRGGHRKYNHDMVTGFMKGYNIAGFDGAYAAMMHQMEDVFSDTMVKSIGVDGRDMMESMFNMLNKTPQYNFNQKRFW